MNRSETQDLIGIIRDARCLDAPDHCLNVLKALPWTSPAEKAEVWRQLPLSLRRWLSQSVQGPQSA